ncbi:MAG: molybdenum cofactor guanylyltransferase [Candidatus Wallbacteria bacterium]|nr:molybdenum cofactor guanylyltransferase [Candidatus Wallbacteria bacterium]
MPVIPDTASGSAFSAAILAGGASRRFGSNKALAMLAGEPLLARSARLLSGLTDDVFVVANAPALYERLGLRVFPDPTPDHGPLSGLEGALHAARYPAVFVAACDMPYLHAGLIHELVRSLEDFDAVMPESLSGIEPLHAVYARRALESIAVAIARGALRMRELPQLLRTRVVSAAAVRALVGDTNPFANANTPEELQRLLSSLRNCP